MSYNLFEIRRRLNHLPQGLVAHCEQVSKTCRDLAQRFGCETDKAELAGLVHDIARAISPEDLLSLARSYHLDISEVEERTPLLLHGPVASEILAREFAITDTEILEAVSCHTTGRSGMSLLDKVVFIADKIQPGGPCPVVEEVRKLAENDLDQAILEFLNWQIAFLIERGSLLHPATIEARNSLLLSSTG